MSRFFETLQEASRLQPDANVNAENVAVETTGATGVDAFSVFAAPEAAEPAAAAIPPIEEARPTPPGPAANGVHVPHEDLFQAAEELFQAVAPARNGSLGVATTVAVDKKAPLMPNANDGVVVEQYRRLRNKIQQQHATKPIQSLLVASPGARDGKTVTTMNLGLSFAMLPSYKVLLIDGDLRKGTLSKWLGVSSLPGLSNFIDGSAQLEEVVFKSDDFPAHFVPHGTSQRASAELLTSPQLGSFVRRMCGHFDLVLIDSPPVNLIADTQVLAGSCDAVLLVARVFSTTCKAFQKTVQDLASFRMIGTVLNGGRRSQLYRRYSKYY